MVFESAAWLIFNFVDADPFGDGINNGSVTFACKLCPGYHHTFPCVTLPIICEFRYTWTDQTEINLKMQ